MMKAILKRLRGLQFKELVTIAALDRPMEVESIAEVLRVKPRTIEATIALPAFEKRSSESAGSGEP